MPKPSARSAIQLRGVRHNNLKNFDLDLPLNQLIVITGLSGSGKSSLAFDTLFAEGQRRYIETFSPYARQFFDRMDKPQVDRIEGIPPAIAIEQRNAVKTTRSTVGTMTEICDHLKLLWPHLARLHCRQCGRPVRKDSPRQIWEELAERSKIGQPDPTPAGEEILITFNLPLSEKLSLADSLALIAKQGYQRLLLKGQIRRLDDVKPEDLTPDIPHLTVLQDRLKRIPANRARFVEACEQAYHFGKGKLAIHFLPDSRPSPLPPRPFSNRLHCAPCDLEYRDPSPALFSFNHPVGACPACKGFGRVISIDYDLAIPDRSRTLAGGVVKPWLTGHGLECQNDLLRTCRKWKIPTDVPFEQLPEKWQDFVIQGEPGYGQDKEHEWPRAWYGVKGYFRWLESKAYKMHVRVLLSRYRAYTLCPECRGARLQPEALLYRLGLSDFRPVLPAAESGPTAASLRRPPVENRKSEITLADFYQLPLRDAQALIQGLAEARKGQIGRRPNDPVTLVFNEVLARLGYLNEVGLGYLTLDRPTRSLSGGETERVNLTTCLGTRLVNTLFVLDEPSVGLHPRDTDRLVRILQRLRDAGNTVVVVEHEASVMRAANQIIDLGPGHGATGGQIVFQGSYPEILTSGTSLTGKFLSGRERLEIPVRRPVAGRSQAPERRDTTSDSGLALNDAPHPLPGRLKAAPRLQLSGVNRHNLNNVTVEIPLQRFVALTGVSGSGKTTLIREVLLPVLEADLKSQIAGLKPTASRTAAGVEDRSDADSEERQTSGGPHPTARISGHEHLSRVVLVDQSLLGKTPRSNPAVYIGAFDDIREVFAQSELARQSGLNASAFSFNSAQGQCERCRGAGFEKIEMQFLSDVFIRCPDCNGRRYRQHILDVKIRGASPEGRRPREEWSIGDLLEATVDEVIGFLSDFAGSKPAARAVGSLKLLQEVGLGYLKLGQPINTLSGGESQRLKLVRHLAESLAADIPDCRKALNSSPAEQGLRPSKSCRANSGGRMSSSTAARMAAGTAHQPTLFLFDEPTTGLHFEDVRILLRVFQRLVDAGHSVLVIEHNLDVIKSADWVIDLGPGAGDEGGRIVAEGTPEQVAACLESHTGQFLREMLPAAQKTRRALRA